MNDLTEIRWHARAGQGAKTASQILALALLRSGRYAQSFPEYGPERRGAPLRAYTRSSGRPIRRHDAIEHPDAVVVLEPSLADRSVTEGLTPDGVVLVNTDASPRLDADRVVCVDASRIAGTRGSGFANIAMLGAVAAALGEPPLRDLEDAAVDVLGKKVDANEIRAAVTEGYRCLA